MKFLAVLLVPFIKSNHYSCMFLITSATRNLRVNIKRICELMIIVTVIIFTVVNIRRTYLITSNFHNIHTYSRFIVMKILPGLAFNLKKLIQIRITCVKLLIYIITRLLNYPISIIKTMST